MLTYDKGKDELSYSQGDISYSKKYSENLEVDYDINNSFVGFKVFNVTRVIDEGYEFLDKPSTLVWDDNKTFVENFMSNCSKKEYKPGVYFITPKVEGWDRLILHWENEQDYESGAYPWSEEKIAFSHKVEDDSIIGIKIWRIEEFIGYERGN